MHSASYAFVPFIHMAEGAAPQPGFTATALLSSVSFHSDICCIWKQLCLTAHIHSPLFSHTGFVPDFSSFHMCRVAVGLIEAGLNRCINDESRSICAHSCSPSSCLHHCQYCSKASSLIFLPQTLLFDGEQRRGKKYFVFLFRFQEQQDCWKQS